MKKKQSVLQIVLGLLLLFGIAYGETSTDVDMQLQRALFSEGGWFITPADHARWGWLFYSGPKKILVVLGILCLLGVLTGVVFSWRHPTACRKTDSGLLKGPARPPDAFPAAAEGTVREEPAPRQQACGVRARFWMTETLCPALVRMRRSLVLMILALSLVPACLGGAKQWTNIYCPYQLEAFGGTHVYQRLFESADPANAGLGAGQCFPAGHATGGFALLVLFFVFPRRLRWYGLSVGLAAGWLMGGYQMLRGQHFLSHTLFTMVGSWVLIVCIVLGVDFFQQWWASKVHRTR